MEVSELHIVRKRRNGGKFRPGDRYFVAEHILKINGVTHSLSTGEALAQSVSKVLKCCVVSLLVVGWLVDLFSIFVAAAARGITHCGPYKINFK
jgi:hypothetical protein